MYYNKYFFLINHLLLLTGNEFKHKMELLIALRHFKIKFQQLDTDFKKRYKEIRK